jgi:hypothetical protein
MGTYESVKRWRARHPEAHREQVRKYRARNPEKIKEQAERSRKKHRVELRKRESIRQAGMVVFLNDYKSARGCSLCDEKDPVCLDFHHKNPDEKEFNIATVRRAYGKKRLLAEIEKCAVICSNCHRKLHRRV